MKELIIAFGSAINLAITVVAGIAVLIFFYGVMKFVFQAGDEKKRAEGRSVMVWGLITMFVILGVWGLVAFLRVALGLDVYTIPFRDPGPRAPIPRTYCTEDPNTHIRVCTTI